MTKSLIEKILKLFAITAQSGMTDFYQRNFNDFLNINVAEKYHRNYSELFENYLNDYSNLMSEKKVSLNSVRIISLCNAVVEKSLPAERLKILIYLINFTRGVAGLNELQREFLILIADVFELKSVTTNDILHFTESDFGELHANKYISYALDGQGLHFYKTEFDLILVKSLDGECEINHEICKTDIVYLFDIQSIIKDYKGRLINYRELNNLFNNSENCSFRLIVNDVDYIKGKTVILHKTSFAAESGELIAVIGKSGAGKTTLLKRLAGIYKGKANDVVLVNAENQARVPEAGYLEQEPSFLTSLSIVEHLKDRLEYLQIPALNHSEILSNLLELTELQSHKDKIPEKGIDKSELSGGQKKRLAMALSLAANPELIILDEPLSGLSSDEAKSLVSVLRNISLKSKVVICSVHQPDADIFRTFDKVLVIDDFGYPVFYGKPIEAAEYFAYKSERVDKNIVFNNNFTPGIILEILNQKSPLNPLQRIKNPIEWNIDFINSGNQTAAKINIEKLINNKRKTNKLKSLSHFLAREISIQKRNIFQTLAMLIIPLFLALLISIICRYSVADEYAFYHNPNVPVWILMMLLTSFFVGLISTGHEFIQNRKFRICENYVSRKTNLFTLSKIIKALVVSVLQTLIFCAVSLPIIELSWFISDFFIIFLSMNLLGCLSGLLLSSIFNSVSLVYFFAPILIIPQLLLAGAVIPFDNFNKLIKNEKYVPIIASVVPLRLTAEALMIRLYISNPIENANFEKNVVIAESSYYLNYFLPEIESIYLTDSVRAIKMLERESIKNQNILINNTCFRTNIEALKIIFRNNLSKMDEVQYIPVNYDDLINIRLKYSNKYVADLLQNRNISNHFYLKQYEIVRKYKPIYKLPDNSTLRNHMFTPYKRVSSKYVSSNLYNFCIMLILCTSVICVIFLLEDKKKT